MNCYFNRGKKRLIGRQLIKRKEVLMTNVTRIAALVLLAFGTAVQGYAQTARVQGAYAGTDPQLATVDIYFSVSGVQVGVLEDIEGGGDATAFLDILAGIPITAGIAPGNSTSIADVIQSAQVTFGENTTNIVVASGLTDPNAFAPNPDGLDVSLTVFVLDTARESAVNPTDLDFVFFHGSTDTPTIDIFVRGGAQVADDLAYGGFSDYASLAPGTYTLDVADATTGAFLASFLADVTAEMAGRAAGVGLLGFSDPSANQNGAPLSLTALFAEGAVAWLPAALPTGIEAAANDNEIVTAFALSQNYPNPFNPNSTISFALPEPHLVRLKVYNMAGQYRRRGCHRLLRHTSRHPHHRRYCAGQQHVDSRRDSKCPGDLRREHDEHRRGKWADRPQRVCAESRWIGCIPDGVCSGHSAGVGCQSNRS